jgi:putative heme-binding domain-containing protein
LYHGAAFTCDPTGNLVHMEILTPKGATFESRPHKKGVEFLASPDDWFRPVFLTHGPEGAMYVVDMYRAVIEHPQFMPPELKNRPDLTLGKDKGRIWRIVPKNHKFSRSPLASAPLSKATIPDLVKTLAHPEPWWRQTAQALLLEKNDKAMIEPLAKLLNETKSPHAKILAAWMLERQGKLSNAQAKRMWQDEHARVREHALRISEYQMVKDLVQFHKDPLHFQRMRGLARDTDARVRFQLVLSLAESGVVGGAGPTLGDMVLKSGRDRWTLLAAHCSAPTDIWMLLNALTNAPEGQASPEMIRDTSILFAAHKENMRLLLHSFQFAKKNESVKWATLAGFAEGLERRGKTLLTASSELKSKNQRQRYMDEVLTMIAEARKHVQDAKKPLGHRLLTLRIVSHAPWPTAKTALVPLVEKETNIELRIAALRALASQQDKEVATLLMKLWPGATPSVRREILEAMLRQPARVTILLDEIESKRMKASELDPLRTRQLLGNKNAAIRDRARKLLASNLPADRAKVLAQYQAALTMKGDAKRGRDIFKKECAICHRVAGIGIDVGPDIADTRTKTLGAMLNDILAPNSAIDANYVNYVVSTKDGRILTGLLTAESASSITLVRAEKQMDVVLRKDIDEIASTGVSLMPEGFETKISVPQMADLLRFLKDWRYLDGSVPLR